MSLRIAPSTAHASVTTQVPSAPSAPGLPDTLRNSTTLPAASASANYTATNKSFSSSGAGSGANTSTHAQALARPHLHAQPSSSSHPLEARLAGWRSTAHALKMTGLRRTFGIAEPVRRGMELNIAREGEWRPLALGGSEGVSGDVLEGRDWCVDWEDVYDGGIRDGLGLAGREEGGMLGEMEAKVKMGAL